MPKFEDFFRTDSNGNTFIDVDEYEDYCSDNESDFDSDDDIDVDQIIEKGKTFCNTLFPHEPKFGANRKHLYEDTSTSPRVKEIKFNQKKEVPEFQKRNSSRRATVVRNFAIGASGTPPPVEEEKPFTSPRLENARRMEAMANMIRSDPPDPLSTGNFVPLAPTNPLPLQQQTTTATVQQTTTTAVITPAPAVTVVPTTTQIPQPLVITPLTPVKDKPINVLMDEIYHQQKQHGKIQMLFKENEVVSKTLLKIKEDKYIISGINPFEFKDFRLGLFDSRQFSELNKNLFDTINLIKENKVQYKNIDELKIVYLPKLWYNVLKRRKKGQNQNYLFYDTLFDEFEDDYNDLKETKLDEQNIHPEFYENVIFLNRYIHYNEKRILILQKPSKLIPNVRFKVNELSILPIQLDNKFLDYYATMINCDDVPKIITDMVYIDEFLIKWFSKLGFRFKINKFYRSSKDKRKVYDYMLKEGNDKAKELTAKRVFI